MATDFSKIPERDPEIHPFDAAHVAEAAELFCTVFEEARQRLPLIPPKPDLSGRIEVKLADLEERPGVSVFREGRLIGYMVENFVIPRFFGVDTPVSGLWAHAAVWDDRERIYQRMYEHLSALWVKRGLHSHAVIQAAGDQTLTWALHRLGFGMTHMDLLRDLSPPVGKTAEVEVTTAEYNQLAAIEKEHSAYYSSAPLFWIPWEDKRPPQGERKRDERIVSFAVQDRGEVVAFMSVRRGGTQSLFGQDERTANVTGAYAKVSHRGKGIGTTLLASVVDWAREQGCQRLSVDCESANIFGGNFWLKHFSPVSYGVRRCVDHRIGQSDANT